MDYSDKSVIERSAFELAGIRSNWNNEKELSPVAKGTKAKELIDELEYTIGARRCLIHENQEFIDKVVSYERTIRECDEQLKELLGYSK